MSENWYSRLRAVADALSDLAAAPIPPLPVDNPEATIRMTEEIYRLSHAVVIRMAGIVDADGLAVRDGYANAPTFLRALLQISLTEARSRLNHARLLHRGTATPNDTSYPMLPDTAAGLESGAIGSAQLEIITRTAEQLIATGDADRLTSADRELAAACRTSDLSELRRRARREVAHLTEDEVVPSEAPEQCRDLRFSMGANGVVHLRGRLDAEAAERVRAVIDALSGPCRQRDGNPDLRSTGRRQADCLVDVFTDHGRGRRARKGKQDTQLIVTMSLEDLRRGTGTATLPNGAQLSATEVRRLACTAGIVPMVLDGKGIPLEQGRSKRFSTRGQDRALHVRDKHCTFPSCRQPSALCESHHVWDWDKGGPTDMNNLALLCPAHHRLVHRADWRIVMTRGRPRFHPPAWLHDPGEPVAA
jgi:hypothetical protein